MNMIKLYKLMMRHYIAAERINTSYENLENHQSGSYPTTLYSVLRSPILLRYPLLNLRLDDFIMIQTAYVIYQNAKLAYDVEQVSCVLLLRRQVLILCDLSLEQL